MIERTESIMSESNNNVTPQEEPRLSRAQQVAAEDAKHKRNTKIYGAATLLLLLAAIAAVVWNSAYFQSNAVAATVGGEDYTVAEMSYYYYSAMQEELYNAYYYYTSSYNPYLEADEQMYSDTQTFHDYFLDVALAELQSVHAMMTAAQEAGFSMDADDLASQITSYTDDLMTQAVYYGLTSSESYLQAYVSSYLTMEIFEEILTDQLTAYAYVEQLGSEITFSDDELNAYYDENKDDLDTYVLNYTVHVAYTPTAEEDEELTDEEIAAGFEENKAAEEAIALEIMARLEDGEDFATITADYETYGAYENDTAVGTSVNTSLSEWAMSEDRQAGDITMAEYEGTDRYVYYVAEYVERYQDNTPTASVRHILISAGSDPTQEEYDAAYAQAESVLAQWESGSATADSFGDFAALYSADTGSNTTGGVVTGLTPDSAYVASFLEWCVDSDRQPGDTGLVINEESSVKGWHIMYFEEWPGSQWQVTAKDALLTLALDDWHAEITAATAATLESGIKYLG